MTREQSIEEVADIITGLFNPKLTRQAIRDQNARGWDFETVDDESGEVAAFKDFKLFPEDLVKAIKLAEKWGGRTLPENL